MPESFLDGRVTMLCGDVRAMLATLPDNHFDCVVTSPPYWGLRNYGTARWEGGVVGCEHEGDGRWYTEKTASTSSAGAFSKPGQANIDRLKKGRWRERGHCIKCGALHVDEQIGLERTLGEHIAAMVDVFRDVRRVLKPTGVCWINYGDCYATAPNGRSAADTKAAGNDDRTFRDKPFSTIGPIQSRANGGDGQHHDRRGGFLKSKDLCMVPERLFIALQDDGWWVRSKLPWIKRNSMPESITDRPANSLEQVAMLTKSERYWYDADAVRKSASASTNARVAQNVASQAGSLRANGGAKTNGPMKAVVRRPGVTPKSAAEGTNIKAKGSFHASTTEVLNDRNFRNTDLFFSSMSGEPWGLVSDVDGTPLAIDANPQGFSEAHFATFPIALIEPLIKAGCPSMCCDKCGIPMNRVTQHIGGGRDWHADTMVDAGITGEINGAGGNKRGRSKSALNNTKRYKTVGWIAGCDCGAPHTAGRVLDPFGGAGTTALVAASLGRSATLIELNPEYVTLARARIEAAFMGKDEGARHMIKQLGKGGDAGPLFGGEV